MINTGSRINRTIILAVLVCLFGFQAQAQYGGGMVEPNNLYQIATAEDLILFNENPNDYDKHFILTVDIQTASTFPEAGWGFVDETENGTEDIWWILEGQDYPRLWWELIPEN